MPVDVRRAYADSRWGQLHYRIAQPPGPATRPPLLCLHQTPKSGWEYEPLMAVLGERRVVIAPDTPGYGNSDGPDEPASIEDLAAALGDLMDIRPGPFDVMGTHTGSLLAAELARSRPARVGRAVLLGLAAYDAETRAEKLAKLANYPRPKDDLSHVEAVWKVMQTLFDPRASVAWRHRSLAENLRSGERMSWGYAAVYRYDFIETLKQVRQPTLVLNPDDDLSAVTAACADLLPAGRRVDLPGAKHGLFAIEADKVAGIVEAFLDEA